MIALFDESKFYLGKICKNGHDWEGTGESLRYLSRSCVQCCKEQHEIKKEVKNAKLREKYHSNLEESRERIRENYAKHRHTINSNRALRRRENPEPERLRQNEWYKENRDSILARRKVYYLRDRGKILEEKKDYGAVNRERITLSKRLHRQTPEGKEAARLRSRRLKTVIFKHGTYSLTEWSSQLNHFNGCCAYCGKASKITRDHLVSLHSGGNDLIGNVIPACARCNASKQAKAWHEWYLEQPFYSKAQVDLIKSRVGAPA